MTTPAAPLTLEQKILLAAQQSETVLAIFSAPAAAMVAAGVEVEPIFSGFVQMILALFKHHVTPPPAPAPAPTTTAPAPSNVAPTTVAAPASTPATTTTPADGSNVPVINP